MSEKQQTTAQPTTTKDYTPARLKIEKEYNDKRTGSGWQRHYKVIILHPLYVVRTYIQEELSYSGQKQRVSTHRTQQAGKRTHRCVKTHTHTNRNSDAQTLLFLFDSISTKMWWVRKRLLQMPMPPTHIHTHSTTTSTYTHELAWIYTCVCVWLCRTAARGQPHCAIIVVAAVAVMWACACICSFWCLPWSAAVAQQEQQQQQPNNSGLWLQVCGARATFGRNFTGPFSQTHTHSNLPAYTLIRTCTRKQAHRHSQHIHKQTLSAHLLHFACALACCSWMLLPLPLALLRFAALSSLANCNSLKFG